MLLYKIAKPGTAIIRYGVGGIKVSLNSLFYIPFLQRVYELDVSEKEISFKFNRESPIYIKDKKALSLEFSFRVKIDNSIDSLRRVAENIKVENTFDHDYINRKFSPSFRETCRMVFKSIDHYSFSTKKDQARMEILSTIGKDLNGFIICDLSINELN